MTRGALLPGDELAFASAKFRVHLTASDPEASADDDTEMLTEVSSDIEAEASADVEDADEPPFHTLSDSDVRFLSDDSDA